MISPSPLLDVLGATRRAVVDLLQGGERTAAELAGALEITPAAARRHLVGLEADGVVEARTVHDGGPGRPHQAWRLTREGRALGVDRTDELANEALAFIEAQLGRDALRQFLRARADRDGQRYADAMADLADASAHDRAARLAELLSADGYAGTLAPATAPDGKTVLALVQGHCSVEDVAREHPEICAYEAQWFKQLLGTTLTRKQTIARGADVCICHLDVPPATVQGAGPHGDPR